MTLSGAIAGDVAGQPAYTVRVSPKHDGGLLGAVELAFGANHAVPLRVAVLSQGDSSPVLALTATDISFGTVPSADLAVRLAPGTKIVHRASTAGARPRVVGGQAPDVSGAAAVAGAARSRWPRRRRSSACRDRAYG